MIAFGSVPATPGGTVVGGRSKPITSAQSAACSVNDPCPFARRLRHEASAQIPNGNMLMPLC
jgi:hypothetical protein